MLNTGHSPDLAIIDEKTDKLKKNSITFFKQINARNKLLGNCYFLVNFYNE